MNSPAANRARVAAARSERSATPAFTGAELVWLKHLGTDRLGREGNASRRSGGKLGPLRYGKGRDS